MDWAISKAFSSKAPGNGDIGGNGAGEGNVVAGNQREALKALMLNAQELTSQLRIFSNSFGTKPDGINPLGNSNNNIFLDSVPDVTIDGNAIAASQTGCGVYISDTQQVLARPTAAKFKGSSPRALGGLTKLFRNKVGLGKLFGGLNLGNFLGGICVDNAANVQIGDTGLGNEIAGNNNGPGIHLFGQLTELFKVAGNFIGTTSDGRIGLGNGLGLLMEGVRNGDIGGMSAAEGNVISGNSQEGIKAVPRLGEALELVSNLRIFSNKFGVKPNETGVLGNTKDNIFLDGASDITIQENLIAASLAGCGVQVKDTSGVLASRIEALGPNPHLGGGFTKLFKNQVGLSRLLQNVNLGNFFGGICIENAPGVRIGDVGLGNEIGGSANGPGVFLMGVRTQLTELFGNFIGTDSEGRSGLGNLMGVLIQGGKNNTVGGSLAGLGNTIGFNQNGIVVKDNAEANRLMGNLVGLFRNFNNTFQTIANLQAGIRIENSTTTLVGEPGVPATRNLISANGGPGVVITGSDATFNTVANNSIGTDDTGTLNLGNALQGVLLIDGARLNTIGGPASGSGNTIAFNIGAGVALDASAGHCNNIDPNTIFGNGGLGIDLGNDGPTANDPGDADAGPNNLQNFPEITSAVINSTGALVIQYKVDSAPANSDYGSGGLLIEFFEADANNSGRTFLGNTHYTQANYLNGSPGMASFILPNAAAAGISVGDRIVASTTDQLNNTSEFTSTNVGLVVAPTAANGVVSGQILTDAGLPVAGVTIELSGTQSRITITDNNGFYRFDGVETTGFYVVSPARANYSFNPSSRAFSLLQETVDADFIAVQATTDTANPLESAAFFVRQQYLDILGREPDPGGFSYWLNEITNCGSDAACLHRRRLAVSDAFFVESEWQATGGFLNRVHKSAFAHYPSFIDYLADRAQLSGGAEARQRFLTAFVERGSFVSRYPASLPPSTFVAMLDANSGNVLTESQNEQLTAGLINGTETRATVLGKIADNQNFVESNYNSIFVTSLYLHYLRREPEQGGFEFWLSKINEFPPHSLAGQHSLVCAFITSREYQERFSSVVTRTNADCGRW